MKHKLLIANRGEIACRIIKTAKSMGWDTVAVYSSADKSSLHVKLADEAYLIGNPSPAESYLVHEAILEAARTSQATAIHPGYGFLSENPEFAAKCSEQNIVFVGPPASAVNVMGLKGVARQCMQDANVPVLPGINKITDKTTIDEIAALGFPVLIKPEAGGGGKGMKIVHREEELEAALVSAKREARSAFGNDSLMVEKYLVKPRHIEIQVFADQHGNCIHLNERDCSLQRRHQKIIEESPAPLFSNSLRQQMGEAAVSAAKAIDYVGAGTVEFLLADDGKFYFMEMNTRLQVEHPVTELITGLDLVEWQLKIALGEALPLTQDQIGIHGHAMEVRIYAEDPSHDFLPVSGEISHLRLPESMMSLSKLRIDNGVQVGDQVGVFYDPMLMKLIAWAPERSLCIEQLSSGISELEIAGIRTNRDFLHRLISHPPFQAGGLGTDYLDNNLGQIIREKEPKQLLIEKSAICLYLIHEYNQASNTEIGFRLNGSSITKIEIESEDELHELTIETEESKFKVILGDQKLQCQLVSCSFGKGSYDEESHVIAPFNDAPYNKNIIIDVDQIQYRFRIHQREDSITLFSDKYTTFFSLSNEEQSHSEEEGGVNAPMSGKIVEILVSEGENIAKGSPMAILEAMKMEHTIRAPYDGMVQAVHFATGDIVNDGIPLFDFPQAS